MNSNVKQNSSSTLEGSVLILTCKNEISSIMNVTNEEILSATCHSSGNWIPDPAQFTCSPSGSCHKFKFLLPVSITIFKLTHSCISLVQPDSYTSLPLSRGKSLAARDYICIIVLIRIPSSTIVSWARSLYAHPGKSHSK